MARRLGNLPFPSPIHGRLCGHPRSHRMSGYVGDQLWQQRPPLRVTMRSVTAQLKEPARLVTTDADIRRVLLSCLGLLHGDPQHDLIIEEFGCKSARVDVAVVNGSLHAYEIKSDSDSLARLSSQIEAYQAVFEYVTLIVGERLLAGARNIVPKSWGLQKAGFTNGKVVLRQLRKPTFNRAQNPLALAKMLWKREAIAVLRKYDHRDLTARNTAVEVSQAVASLIPTRDLTQEVRLAIKARGGSGFPKRLAQDGDLYTTGSIARVSRPSDLDWLLSPQYQNHPD